MLELMSWMMSSNFSPLSIKSLPGFLHKALFLYLSLVIFKLLYFLHFNICYVQHYVVTILDTNELNMSADKESLRQGTTSTVWFFHETEAF